MNNGTGIRYSGCLFCFKGSFAGDLCTHFCRYIYGNRYAIMILVGSIFLVHGGRLFSTAIGIDTESIIYEEAGLYESWMRTGRYGLVLLKYLTGTLWFNPFFDSGITLVFLTAACVCFGFLFHVADGGEQRGKDGWQDMGLLPFGIIASAHPILTEQLYFALQSKEITLGFVLLAMSLYLSHIWAKDKKPGCLAGAAALMVLVFAIYQAMVPLYLAGAAAVLVLSHNRRLGESDLGESVRYLLRFVAAFLTGFVINRVLERILCGSSAYLTGQIRWQSGNIMGGVWGSVAHVAEVITDGGDFYSPAFSLLLLLLFPLVVLRLFGAGSRRMGIWYVLILAGMAASPFYMTLLLGGAPVIRAQLVLPFATGFLAYLAGKLLRNLSQAAVTSMQSKVPRVLKTVLLALTVAVCWREAEQSTRMYYTDAVRSEQDKALGESLKEQIEKASGLKGYAGKVMFVGIREEELDEACAKGDVCGQSLFAWDYAVEPVNYWSVRRIIGYMHTLGAAYTMPDKEEAARAAVYAQSKPSYPADGSIAIKDNMVIVKLGNQQ